VSKALAVTLAISLVSSRERGTHNHRLWDMGLRLRWDDSKMS